MSYLRDCWPLHHQWKLLEVTRYMPILSISGLPALNCLKKSWPANCLLNWKKHYQTRKILPSPFHITVSRPFSDITPQLSRRFKALNMLFPSVISPMNGKQKLQENCWPPSSSRLPIRLSLLSQMASSAMSTRLRCNPAATTRITCLGKKRPCSRANRPNHWSFRKCGKLSPKEISGPAGSQAWRITLP